MRSIKQIRELQVELSESVESASDVRKLATLVRAGLFDPNKLTMLKRALNKENVKMTRAERDALLELLDRLLTTVMANQGAFMKVKQSINEEVEEPTEEELNEASRVDLDINQIPPIIIMKRRAIRVFPDGQKVALYWADRINKYISVPFQSIGISEAKEEGDDDKNSDTVGKYRLGLGKLSSQRLSQDQRQRIKSSAENRRVTLQSTGMRDLASLTRKHGALVGLGGAIGTAINRGYQRSKIYRRARAISSGNTLSKTNPAAFAAKQKAVGIRENYQAKLALIREQRELNEWAPLVAAAARLAPAVIRGVGALARSGAGRAVGGALMSGGKGLVRGTRKVLGKVKGWGSKVLKKFKGTGGKAGAFAAGAQVGGSLGGDGNGNDGRGGSKPDYNYKVDRPDSPAFKGSTVRSTNAYQTARQRQADINFARQQQENYKLIKSIAEGTETKEVGFKDGSVEVTPSMALKIVETYNALNSNNKKIVQEMINKDKNSFMKFANFASSK